VSGHAREHELLEAELAAFAGPCEGARALLFGSGYLANQAILTALCGRDDAVFADKLNHACLNDGALLSRAAFVRYAHGDVQALAARLRAAAARRRIIATDAVFSMDGDVAPLRDILMLAHEHDALVLVDDAHGFGVLGEGRGSVAAAGLLDARIVYMGTLGKAAGVAGAFVAAHPTIVETLVQSARAYIYTTAAPPLLAAALRAALAIVRDDAPRRARVQARIAQFRAGAAKLPWPLLDSATPIQPLVVGDERAALSLGDALWAQDVFVPVIRPPTVPGGSARLRVSLTAAHTQAHVERLLDALGRAAAAS
jgi:8-amino-7-oxononanoate synthase